MSLSLRSLELFLQYMSLHTCTATTTGCDVQSVTGVTVQPQGARISAMRGVGVNDGGGEPLAL